MRRKLSPRSIDHISNVWLSKVPRWKNHVYKARYLERGFRFRCQKYSISSDINPRYIEVNGELYPADSWTNVPTSIANAIPRRLHLQPAHPISLTRQLIESRFPSPTYKRYNQLSPIVSVHQNFDSLGFPRDHPGRSRTDTYYINENTVLRTHTSAHQVDTFRTNPSEGYTISADVYRRDAIDRSHNPVFHQMEGARMWDRRKVRGGNIAAAVQQDLDQMLETNLQVEDLNPTVHPERNPLQSWHRAEEVEAIATHLKRSLEGVVVELFSKTREMTTATGPISNFDPSEPLKIRWVEAYFPFTSPSWELEVFWQGDWLELLGCGVVKQELPNGVGLSDSLGWAFGIGLERVAMLLFSIPDIRLFWSQDRRFLSQFSTVEAIRPFVPFSKYPACYKDVAFWLRSSGGSSAGGSGRAVHENDIMEVIREVGGGLVEDVQLVDEFSHPSSGRKSLCYRINYRSLERTLWNREANQVHEEVRKQLVEKLEIDLR